MGGEARLARVVMVVIVLVQVVANEGGLKNLATVKGALIDRRIVDLWAFAADAGRHELLAVLRGAALVAQVGHLARAFL